MAYIYIYIYIYIYMVYINWMLYVNINARRTTLCGRSIQVSVWYKYRGRWPGGPTWYKYRGRWPGGPTWYKYRGRWPGGPTWYKYRGRWPVAGGPTWSQSRWPWCCTWWWCEFFVFFLRRHKIGAGGRWPVAQLGANLAGRGVVRGGGVSFSFFS